MTSQYVLHNNGSLSYVDLDDSELMHWKYVKKKRLPNGKWRYYYDVNQLKNDLGFDERAAYRKAVEREASAYNDWQDKTAKATRYLSLSRKYGEPVHDANKKFKNTMASDWTNSYKTYVKRGKELADAESAYMKTPLGKLSKMTRAIFAGAQIVASIFSRKK